MMKHIAFILLVSYIGLVYSSVVWEDCGIPLTRKIYYQGVVLSPSTIKIASQNSDTSISVNINSQTKDYTVLPNSTVHLEVLKDGETFFDGPVADLCQILSHANGETCPLPAGQYSFSYQYKLPPLPTGSYSVTLKTYEPVTNNQIGCLSVQSLVVGLGEEECSYTSTLSASFVGTAQYLNDNTMIQVGPWGPNGLDLGYQWGTFKSISATPDLVGYAFKADNYVWGLTGYMNNSVSQNQFDGTIVIGIRPDVSNAQYAKLVYQGVFSWKMIPSTAPAFIFDSGTVTFNPGYAFPADFPYPLNLGNLGTMSISQNDQQTSFKIDAFRKWCRCNCDNNGVGKDASLTTEKGKSGSGRSKWVVGTIIICVVGSCILIAAAIVIVRIRRSKPRPVVYDDADLMDPQKPDYGTIAINEAFEAEEQEYI